MENLTRVEWFYIRQALGRPRRFSQAFVRSEMELLEQQRDMVRMLQQGLQPETSGNIPLPQEIPLPLAMGQRVLARAPAVPGIPGGLIFPGYVLAICCADCAYRIEFDAPSIGVRTVSDIDVSPVKQPQMISVKELLKERIHMPSAGIAERYKAPCDAMGCG